MEAAQAAAISRGRQGLVLGDEIGVTACEVSTAGDRIRFVAADLRIAARALRENLVEFDDFEALVVVSSADGSIVSPGGVQHNVAVEILGGPQRHLTVLSALDPM